ncbi:MAG: hypothetical protein P1U56_23650 [Saprospiraceae bacterium]|nr:hypothetical protein [Saprospiraceae bacterium]
MKSKLGLRFILPFVALVFSLNLKAQEQENEAIHQHAITFKTQFLQIKDDFNYGLTFSGINLMAGYAYLHESEQSVFSFESEIGFGGIFNKGAGLAWRFKPVDLFYGHSFSSMALTFGGYVSADYQWQQYSELQGGRLFWFSSNEVGIRLRYIMPFKSKKIAITLSNSLAGFAARPEPGTETHYYTFSFSEFFSTAHQNATFGFVDAFFRSKLEIELLQQENRRFSIAYQFEYFGYYDAPTLSFLNHSINLKYRIGK